MGKFNKETVQLLQWLPLYTCCLSRVDEDGLCTGVEKYLCEWLWMFGQCYADTVLNLIMPKMQKQYLS